MNRPPTWLRRSAALTAGAAALLTLAACQPSAGGTSATAPATSPPSASPRTDQRTEQPVPTALQFSNSRTTVEVTLGDTNPAVLDLVERLPLEVSFEDFNRQEKIAYLPDGLQHEGSPGSDPDDGDLIYYVPWGNLGFFYNADGVAASDQIIHIGTFTASEDQLEALQEAPVTIRAAAS